MNQIGFLGQKKWLLLVWTLCLPAIAAEPESPEMAEPESKAAIMERLRIIGDRSAADPGALSFISADNIDVLAPDHPAEILNTLPGVNIQMNSGQENLPAIRSPVLTLGAGQGSILLLENGVPLRSAPLGNTNALFETNIGTADLVEVIRGPGSAHYGSNALHGLVNVIAPEPLESLRYKASVSGGYFNRWNIKSVGQGLVPAAGIRSALAIQLKFDNGWRDSSGLNEQKGSFQLGGELMGWNLTAYLAASRLDQQTAAFLQCDAETPLCYKEAPLLKANSKPDAFRNAWSVRSHLRAETIFAGGKLSIIPYMAYQGMHFPQHFLPNGAEEKNSQNMGGLMAKYERSLGILDISVGTSVEGADGHLLESQQEPFGFFPSDNRFPAGDHYDYRVDIIGGSAWIEAVLHVLPSLRALAAFRGEGYDFRYRSNIAATEPLPEGVAETSQSRFQVVPDRSDQFSLLIPKLGVIWSPEQVPGEIFFNYSAGGRVPQASDLYRLQSQQRAGEFGPEHIHSVELGARGDILSEQIAYALSGFWMRKDNVSFRDSQRRNFTGGKTLHYGIEASLAGQRGPFHTGLSVSWAVHQYDFDHDTGTAGMTEANDIVSGNRIDTAPEWLIDFYVGFQNDLFAARFDLEHIGEYFTDPGNLHSYPGHVVMHFHGSWQLSDRAELFLNMRNLFDIRYADRADFAFGNERYFSGEPFNLAVGLRFNYL